MRTDLRGRPLRVLVADDSADGRGSLAVVLRLWGCEVCVAQDGEQAVERARSFVPDVLLLDVALPLPAGNATALRRSPGLTDALLVAIDRPGMDPDVGAAREAEFDHCLPQLYELDELKHLLQATGRSPLGVVRPVRETHDTGFNDLRQTTPSSARILAGWDRPPSRAGTPAVGQNPWPDVHPEAGR
jgi:CheY-like chemotaxis protein